ncbi:hypothetical protein ACSLN1_25825, partial [Escherichia coli]
MPDGFQLFLSIFTRINNPFFGDNWQFIFSPDFFTAFIAEALLGNLSKCEDTKRRSEIITVCHRSADVIEHISQYAIE